MSSLIHLLEYVKYHTLFGRTITHNSNSAQVDYSNVQISTPEGKDFLVKRMIINYFKPQEKENCYIKMKWGPSFMKESLSGNTNNPLQDKVYIFHSDQFYKLSAEEKQFEESFFNANVSTGGFWKHIYSVVIQIDGGSKSKFEEFMNIPLGDAMTTGTWRERFSNAISKAIGNSSGNDVSLINLYDPRILKYEINTSDKLKLLENFDTLNLHPDVVLSLLNTQNEITKEAIDKDINWQIINLLKDESKQMAFRLNYFFWNGLSPFFAGQIEDSIKIEYIIKYIGVLKDLFNTQIEIFDIVNIALREKDVYSQYTGSWNLYNKLAENADVFIFNPNFNTPENIFLDYYSNELDEPCYAQNMRDPYFPWDTYLGQPLNQGNKKLAFSYRAFLTSPENMVICHKKILFKDYDPMKLVKVYVLDINKDYSKELQTVDTYEKLLKLYSRVPKDADIKYVIMPAICLVNLYTLNIYYKDAQLISFYKTLSLAYISAYFTGLVPIGTLGFYLSLADTLTITGSAVLEAPGVQDALQKYDHQHGTNYQTSINNYWAIIQGGVLAINLTVGSIWGVMSIDNLVTNYGSYRIALTQFKNEFNALTPELRSKLRPLMENGWLHLDNVVSDWEDYLRTVDKAFKPGWTVGRVLQNRANNIFDDPSVYLTESYINAQYAKYQNGYSFLTIDTSIESYLNSSTRPNIGPDVGKFASSYDEMTQLLTKTDGNLSNIQNEIGILPGSDDFIAQVRNGAKVLRVDVLPHQVSWYRFPKGNELGANPIWLPGAITPKNWIEIIIEPIPKIKLNPSQVTYVKLK